ncbi:MAG TPA: hypothetical protein VFY45_28200, partial [Baekduia sp.]|nr:hypothetical protein [Baekduia sp.]
MDPSSLDAAYLANLDAYKNLGREVKFGLDQALAQAGIKPHAVTFRVKDLGSLRTKADDKGWTDPLNEATDIVGARVVVPFQSDVPRAHEVVRSTFKIIKEENKSSPAEVSSFGYAGLHLDAQIRESHAGPRYNALKAFRFEVQVRTIVEDAWAAVSHILAYKGRSSIPEELQRDFYALSGLFYIADQHFELFHKDAVKAGQRATAQVAAAEAE